MAQDRLTEGALLFPGMPTPLRDPPGGGYRIQRAIDAGGFGITYEAIKREGGDPAADVTANLWLPPYKTIVIKEFFPDFASRRGRTITIEGEDESHDDTFFRALQRFQREAERLCYLTCLRALRAGRSALSGSSGVLGQRIDAEIVLAGQGDTDPGRAMQLVGMLDGEARKVAQDALANSTLPIVYDFFAADNNAYYVMEFLAGGTLKGRLNEDRRNSGIAKVEVSGSTFQLRKPWDPDRLRNFAIAALEALEELHTGIPGQQLIHCDLKPGNIMFRSLGSDNPVLIDFGLARNVADGKSRSLVAGTTGFAPLEIDPHTRAQYDDDRFGGANVGPWTDIYSMAAILRMLATGVEGSRLPAVFERLRTPAGDVDPVDKLPPFPPGFPEAMERGIKRGMALHMRDRPQSVAEWCDELGLNQKTAPASGATGWGMRRSWGAEAASTPAAPLPPSSMPSSPVEEAEAETLVEFQGASARPAAQAPASTPAAREATSGPVIAKAGGTHEPTQLILGTGDAGATGGAPRDWTPPPPEPVPPKRNTMVMALVGGLIALVLITAVLFGLNAAGDGNESAEAEVASVEEDGPSAGVSPTPTPIPTPTATPTPTPTPEAATTPTPAPPPETKPTPTVTPKETPAPKPPEPAGPRYQFAAIGISVQTLGQQQVDQLLLDGVKVNDGVRVTASAGRVPGLGRGTVLASACGGGSAAAKLYDLENGIRSCFRTANGTQWFNPPRM